MSGHKISLDDVQDNKGYKKATLVFKEVEFDDLTNGDINGDINGHITILDTNHVEKSEEPPKDISIPNNHKERIINISEVNMDSMEDELPILSNHKSPPASVTINKYSDRDNNDDNNDETHEKIQLKSASEDSRINIINLEEKKSTRLLEEAIRDAINKHKSSSRASESVSDTKVSGIRISSPYTSTEAREERKAKLKNNVEADEAEIDMAPETNIEKISYYLTKFKILKENYPDVAVPRIHLDGSFKDNDNRDDDEDQIPPLSWQSLRKMYIMELDRVSIGKNVETYKLVMIVLFFITEYIGSRFLKVDITGYTVHSLRSMHRYQRLLIELGEKDYSSFGADWPVEVRIMGLMFVNAIIFVIAKAIFKVTGNDMSDEFFKLFDQLGSQTVEQDIGNMPESVGMDAPTPNSKDNNDGGGLMGMLSGVLGAIGGGGGNGGGGGIGSLLSGLMGAGAGNAGGGTGGTGNNTTTSRGKSKVKRPTYKRKKNRKK